MREERVLRERSPLSYLVIPSFGKEPNPQLEYTILTHTFSQNITHFLTQYTHTTNLHNVQTPITILIVIET